MSPTITHNVHAYTCITFSHICLSTVNCLFEPVELCVRSVRSIGRSVCLSVCRPNVRADVIEMPFDGLVGQIGQGTVYIIWGQIPHGKGKFSGKWAGAV